MNEFKVEEYLKDRETIFEYVKSYLSSKPTPTIEEFEQLIDMAHKALMKLNK